MARLFNETGHAGQDDRNQEAERLIDDLVKDLGLLAPHEQQFVTDMDHKKAIGELFCSPKQLFWLRDLYAKYCV